MTVTTTATADTPAAAAPAGSGGQLTHGQILRILTGLMLGLFLAALDQTIVASAIRTIGDELHGLSVQAWVTTAYLITSTITTPLYGKLSDIYGRKQFFLTAITIFIAGSALCSFATSMYMLAGFRALQGLGAGGLFSLALAILGDIVPPRQRAKYQGYFLAVFGTSSVLGPVIGGTFAGQASILGITGWRWVFLVNVPIGLVALVVVARTLNLPHVRREHRLDYLGALSITVGLVPLLTVAEQGRSWGWSSGRALLCYGVGALGIGAFGWAESRMGEDALIPLRFFRNRTFSMTSVVGLIVGMGMFGGISALPLYLQIVRGATPTRSGLELIPFTLGIMLGSIISGQLISRTGRYKIFPIIGSGLMVSGMLLLHVISADTAYWQTGACMLVFGVGLGNIMQPITLAVQNAMPPQDIGVATSSATFFRQMGGTLGVAVFLSILFSSVGPNINSAFEASATTPAFQAAINSPAVQADPANQPVLAALKGNGNVSSSAINDTSFIQHLDKALARPFQVGFSNSMDLVFLVGAGVLVIGFVMLIFLPELPLRTQSAMAAREPGSPVGRVPDTAALAAAEGDALAGREAAEAVAGNGQSRRTGGDQVAAVALPRVAAKPADGTLGPAQNGSVSAGGWAVRGRVRRPDGTPEPGAALTLTDVGGVQLDRVRADGDGQFRLAPPTGGTYLLICVAPDYQPAASMVAVAGSATPGEVRRDITLIGASRIAGTVRSGEQPVSGASVSLMDGRGDIVGSTTSDRRGVYRLGDLYPGEYTLSGAAAGYRPMQVAVRVPAHGVVDVPIELLASAVVAGIVRAASDGRALPEASVTLIDGAGLVVATGVTDEAGGYRFPELVPGSYTLTASGYAPVATRVEVVSGSNEMPDVALGHRRNGRPVSTPDGMPGPRVDAEPSGVSGTPG